MLMTTEQALAQYHRAYDNIAYQTACGSIAWILLAGTIPTLTSPIHLPEYVELTNLLTDAALECCGHPAYHGAGWMLALRLVASARRCQAGQLDPNAIQRLLTTVDRYLERFRQPMQVLERTLQAEPPQQADFQLAAALHLTAETVRSLSAIPGWQGRAGYHLSAASADLLRTSTILLQATDEATLRYAGEKFNRALHDLFSGLTEMSQHSKLPSIFARVRDYLQQCFEEA